MKLIGKKKILSLLLIMAMLLSVLPLQVWAADNQFTITVTITDAFNLPYGDKLVNGKVMRLNLDIVGPGEPQQDDSFTVKIPKIFMDLTGADLNIPAGTSGFTEPFFEYSGPVADPEDAAYNVYTFTYSDAYKEALLQGDQWTFVRGSLRISLTPNFTQEDIENYRDIEVEDSFSGDVEIVEIPEFPEPDPTEVEYSYLKSIESIWRFDGTSWASTGSKTNVRPGDIIVFRATPMVKGIPSAAVTITEHLPAGLEGYDVAFNDNLQFFDAFQKSYSGYSSFAYNKSNFEGNEKIPAHYAPVAPAHWTKVNATTYTIDLTVVGNQGSHYAHFFAQVKDLKDGVLWTSEDLKNTISGTGMDGLAGGPAIDMHPDMKPMNYDLALVKWITKIYRDGTQVYTNGTVSTNQTPTLANDIVTFAIRVTNQGTGAASVKLSEIIDYAPLGLSFHSVQTQAEIVASGDARIQGMTWVPGTKISPDPANLKDYPYSGTTGYDIKNIYMDAGRTVTPYTTNFDAANGGEGIVLQPAEEVTLYISFTVRDLDETITEIDPDAGWTHIGKTPAQIEAKRKQYRVEENRIDGTNERFSVYYNSAEIYKAYTTGETPVLVNDVSIHPDIDSHPDNNPYNDLYGTGTMDGGGAKKYFNYEMLYGKELNNHLSQSVKSGYPNNDEDDYDYEPIFIVPSPLQPKANAFVEKNWDLTPLKYRVAYGSETSRFSRFLEVIMKQLTPGNVATVAEYRENGDATGRIYGTYSVENTSVSPLRPGQYYNPNTGAWLLGVYDWVTGTYIPKYTNSYPTNGNAALSQSLSDYNIPTYTGGKMFIPGENTVLMYTVAVNADAMTDMNDVTLVDTLPEGFRLLTDVNGEPIVRITRYRPESPGQGYIPELDIYVDAVNRSWTNLFNVYDVKQFTSYDYLDTRHPDYERIYYTRSGERVVFPMPVDNPADDTAEGRRNFWKGRIERDIIQTPTSIEGFFEEQDKLTVYLGDIGYASYDISFLIVNERNLLNVETLTNTAYLTANGVTKESSCSLDLMWDQGAIASFTRKMVINSEGGEGTSNPLTTSGDVTIRYKIGLKSTDSKGSDPEKLSFYAGELTVTDEIKIPSGATLESIEFVGVQGYKVAPGTTTEVLLDPTKESSVKEADVTIDLDERTVTITNGDVMPENRRYYITFDVTYKTVAPGTVIKNTLGSTVTSYAPVEVNLIKQDEAVAPPKPLPDAEFTAYYATADGTAPDTSRLLPILDMAGSDIEGSKVKTDSNGKASFRFSPENFSTVNTWVFYLKETKFPGGYGSETDVLIKYTVTKNAEGTLLVINEGTQTTNTTGTITSTVSNEQKATPAEITVGSKKVTGYTGDPVEFSFTLTACDVDGVVASGATPIYATVRTGGAMDLTFELPILPAGTYYYLLKEELPSPIPPGWTFDTKEVVVEVVIDAAGLATATEVGGEDPIDVEFENTFRLTPTSVTLTATKVLSGTGAPALEADDFTFTLYATDANGVRQGDALQTKKNTSTGSISFDSINYDREGIFYYEIAEVIPASPDPSIDYDDTKVPVVVSVEKNALNALVATVLYDGSQTAPTFTNTYTAPGSTNVEFVASKTLMGESAPALEENDYLFTLYATDSAGVRQGDAIETVGNEADGDIIFDVLSYDDEGTFYYEIAELIPATQDPSITYDTTKVQVIVVVERNASNELVATVTYNGEDAAPIFINTYTAPNSTMVYLKANKLLSGTGAPTLGASDYTFSLYETDSAGVRQGTALESRGNASDGVVAFSGLSFDAAGSYYYEISEDIPAIPDPSIDYDNKLVSVIVEVTLNSDNELVAAVTYDGETTIPDFVNLYTEPGTLNVPLSANKVLSGVDAPTLTAGAFSFTLQETEQDGTLIGSILQTKPNTASGTVSFEAINYDAIGDHYYVIKEVIPGTPDGSITYDAKSVAVKVAVTLNGSNELVAQVTYDGVATVPTFTNNYTAPFRISKREITGDDELPGATLTVYVADVDGNKTIEVAKTNEGITLTWESGSTAKEIKGLAPGKYVLSEEIAPDGYLFTSDIGFTVAADGTVTSTGEMSQDGKTLIMRDRLNSIAISKREITGDDELPGATLIIYETDENGEKTNVIAKTVKGETLSWVSGTVDKEILGLAPGVYVLHEEVAPDGYLVTTDIVFEVDEYSSIITNGETDSDRQTLIIRDNLNEIAISKREITGDDELPGATLTVYETDNNGEKTDTIAKTVKDEELTWVSGTTEKVIKGLTPGTYILHEEAAPDGYLVTTDIEFTVNEDGTITSNGEVEDDHTLIMRDATIAVRISKREITGDDELPGATLIVYMTDAFGQKTDEIAKTVSGEELKWISGDSVKVIEGLAAGTYVLHEEAAPNGYLVTADINFSVNTEGIITAIGEVDEGTNTLIMRDQLKKGKVLIQKINEATGEPVSGAIFALYAEDGVTPLVNGQGDIIHVSTANTGMAEFTDLVYGQTYVIKEISSPVNYDGEISVRVIIKENFIYQDDQSRFFESYSYTTEEDQAVLVFSFKLSNDEMTEVSGKKVWSDDNDKNKKRPEEITVNLMQNGTKIDSVKVKADAQGAWTFTFTDLRKYDNDGKAYTYTITEDTVNGYAVKVEGYTITNTFNPVTKTGDASNDFLTTTLSIMGLMGALAILTVVVARKKKEDTQG